MGGFETLWGSVPALATPVSADGDVDTEGLARLVEHVVEGGVGGFNVLGTSGEFSLVPPRLRERAITAAAAANAGRVVFIVGCGRPSLEETRDEIAQAADLGADAVLVTPSYYHPITGAEVRAWFEALARDARTPLMYYHIPQTTKVAIGADVIGALHADGAIQGIKDSSGVAPFLSRVITLTRHDPGFRSTVGGPFYLVGAMQMGAVGVTGMLGTVLPHLEIAILDAFRAGDIEGALDAQRRLHEFQEWLFLPGRNTIACAKAALEAMGICGRSTWPPIAALDDADAARITEGIGEWLPAGDAAGAPASATG